MSGTTINKKRLVISIIIPLAVGMLAGFLTKDSMSLYASLRQPPLTPPGWLFPIVWSILFVLMGISFYRVWQTSSPHKHSALWLYAIQLAVNFTWSLIFFNCQAYFLALLWLIALWVLIFLMIRRFARIDQLAARLQIPYLAWVTFAGYLTFAIFLLN